MHQWMWLVEFHPAMVPAAPTIAATSKIKTNRQGMVRRDTSFPKIRMTVPRQKIDRYQGKAIHHQQKRNYTKV
jgi:hypothetical protein